MNKDYLFIILLLNATIISLGFVAPIIGLGAAITWASYGITRFVQELANRDNVI